MEQLNIALATIGVAVLVLGVCSRPLNRSVLPLPVAAFAIGILIGPVGMGTLDPATWAYPEKILEETARLTLGISLMGIALRIPPRYPFQHWRTFLVLLGLGMPLMFLISSLLAYWTLGVPFLLALLVGAAICPTDPVVASSIVTGNLAKESLPERFRHTLSTESGANDGLVFPFVLLPILLLEHTAASAWGQWLFTVVLWQTLGAVAFGVLLGWLAGRALNLAERKATIDHLSFLAVTLALTVGTLGLGKVVGMDSILAVFAAGVAFDQVVGGKDRAVESNIQESINLFFTLPAFMLFGVMIPLEKWLELGWGGLALAVLVLLLRRLPVLLLLRPLLPLWHDYRMVITAGYFGPIGISSLFYGMMILNKSGHEIAWTAGSLVVGASILGHGISAAPAARLYHRRYGSEPEAKQNSASGPVR
jgi:NhaP-type Na+/H+ or K+/H+ antiporter